MPAHNSLTLGADRALYMGALPATGWHRHAAPALLVGLSGRFGLQLAGGRVESCRSALVDTGVEHVFDPRGEQVALIYLEPDAPEARGLRTLLCQQGGLVFDPVRPATTRAATDQRLRSFDLASLLRPRGTAPAPLDARVARGLALLRAPRMHPARRADVAATALLSSSRFNHLFSAEMGVSFRSYRVWWQVRAAMMGLGPGINLTKAALHGAFADSSHFSRTFRQTFGMTPSSVLKPLKQVQLL